VKLTADDGDSPDFQAKMKTAAEFEAFFFILIPRYPFHPHNPQSL
jgi:hypothetical protein